MADLPVADHAIEFAELLDWSGFYGNDRAAVAAFVSMYVVWAYFFGTDGPALADLAANFADAKASGKKVIFAPNLSPSDATMTADALAGLDAVAGDWPCDGVYFDEPGGNAGDQAFVEGLLASWATALSDRSLATVPIYVNFSGPALRGSTGKDAAGIDVMGLEAYLDPSLQNNPDVAGLMTVEVQALKAIIDLTDPGRDTFIIIQGYTHETGAFPAGWTNMEALRNIQTPPYEDSYNDARVKAIWGFAWGRPGGTRPPPGNPTGLPECILTQHERIYAAINGDPQLAVISCSSPPPFHSGRKLYLSRTQYPTGDVTYPIPPGTVP